MAIMITLTLGNVPIDVFEQINRELGAVENPPSGLVVHLAHPFGDDAVRVIDVWESEEDHDAFDDVMDPPGALRRLLTQRGIGPPQLIGREVVEVSALLRGPATQN
jgi:heme-degrading monooxygenase HmoA